VAVGEIGADRFRSRFSAATRSGCLRSGWRC